MKFKNIRGIFTKNLKILKIEGSRAEFLDFDFEISNFFWKPYIILIQGKNSKFRQDNALWNLYVVAKIIFFEDQIKSVGQCWFGTKPFIFRILPHEYPWLTSDQKVIKNWPPLKSESNGGLWISKNQNFKPFGLQC